MILLLIAVLLTVSSFAQPTQPNSGIKIIIDQEVQDYESLIINGRTMVPMRAIFEKLGAKVNWCPESRTVEGLTDQAIIILRIDDTLATVDSESYRLDAPATIVNGRTMVPLRFISESLGAEVSWDPQIRSAIINTDTTVDQQSVSVVADVKINSDLRGLTVGMSVQQAERIIGQATSVYDGPSQSQWRTYHDNYQDFYTIGYKNNEVYFIYTNSPGENFAGTAIGDDTPNRLPSHALYREGSLSVNFSAPEEKRVQVANCAIAIYYIDLHDENKISGIRVVSPKALISDVGILSYKLSYTNVDDVPEKSAYALSSQKLQVENAQANIHFEIDNAIRAKAGLNTFSWNSQVAQVAYLHSKDMADNNYFSHTSLSGKSPFTRLTEAGISYRSASENLSWGEGYYDAIESHHGLMNSLGHRKNILDPNLRELGIGASYNSGLYITQNFITR